MNLPLENVKADITRGKGLLTGVRFSVTGGEYRGIGLTRTATRTDYYAVTSNHTHVVCEVRDRLAVADMMNSQGNGNDTVLLTGSDCCP